MEDENVQMSDQMYESQFESGLNINYKKEEIKQEYSC